MPKEVRNPKAEVLAGDAHDDVEHPGFWSWAEAVESTLVLHENGQSDERPPALMDRTAHFGEAIIRFVKNVPRGAANPENNRLVDQLVGAATSIGANYCEADDAVSGKDFRNKIGTCRKESKETMFFLRMIAASEPSVADTARMLWREAKELNLIFGAIWRKRE